MTLRMGAGQATPRRILLTASACLLACAALVSYPLPAQQNASQEVSTHQVQPNFTLRSERNLVTVRVVVRSQDGVAVDNLRQEDFQLFDRGRKQTIVQFSVERPAGKSAELPAEQGKAAPLGQAPGAPSPSSVIRPRRFVALYFDDVNTGFLGLQRTRDAARRFLQASLAPDDRVGVFVASGKPTLDFTADRAKLLEALAALRPNPLLPPDEGCGVVTPYEAYLIVIAQDSRVIQLVQQEELDCSGLPMAPSPEEVRMEALRVQSESERIAAAALRGIESLVRHMSAFSGQRTIVFVSDGFLDQTLGDAVSQISDRALRSNIVISALDARALFVGGATADASVAGRDLPQSASLRALKDNLGREEALRDGEAMGTLARDTGGTFIENTNDLEGGLRRLAAAPAIAYLLAFSPEGLKHDGAFHVLKVAVAQPGTTVQARKGYYAPKKAEDLAAQGSEDLQDAVFSQNEMQALPIQVNTQFFTRSKTDAEIDVVTHVDLHQLHFRKETDRNLGNLTFVTGLFDQDGRYVTGQQKVLEMRLHDANLERFLRSGVSVESDFNVQPGVYLVRTVVRDSESGQISALNRTVEIPY